MNGRHLRIWLERLRWVFLAAAVAIVIVFLVAQQQSADVTYGNSPASTTIPQGSAGELTGFTLPTVAQLKAMVTADKVVRLPGSIAQWDQQRVAAAIGTKDVHILVAPPGLTEAQQQQLYDVDNATILIKGLVVSGSIYDVAPSTLTEWRGQLARNDVTNEMVTLIDEIVNHKDDSGEPDKPSDFGTWRAPTAAELATVTTKLRSSGLYVAPGATLSAAPTTASRQAFNTDSALYVALPAQPRDTPAPDYGPALADVFPNTPIVVMYGSWIEYAGPHAQDFSDVASASFYAQFDSRISTYAYPQDNILNAYLGTVASVRYAGLFDRPLPYHPFDPLRVALPALPWLFGVCVAAFLALSARSLLRPASASPVAAARRIGVPARLAGLTALAVEVSGLTDARTNPALTRAISKLGAAREAMDEHLADRQVKALLDDAEADLDIVGSRLDFAGYRPEAYLRSRLA